MKRVAVLFISLVLITLPLSCEKETFLSVDQTSINISDAGGSSTVSLTANKPWTASSNQSWCKVSPSFGEEATSSRITISCDPNTTYDARNATVTFTCAELTKQVSITQTMNNGLMVTQTSYELTKAAQQLNIEVKANVKFSVEVDSGCKEWVKYNTTKGLTTSTVVLDIAENKTFDSREGKVTIKQDGGSLSSTVTIKQSQLDGLFLTTSEYNLSNEKHTLTVEVSTNVEFDVKPEADWVKYIQTKGLSTKQIVLEVAENDTYDQRETKVNVKQKNGDLSGTITIKQDEKYGFVLSKTEFNLTNEAQNIDVEVKYNVDFEVVIPDGCKEWIKQVSTKGLNTKNYTFSIAKNETYDNREGSITFKQKKGSLSETVAIKQAQTDYLGVAKNEYTVDIEGETITIEVTSNVDYTVSISEDAQSWLSRVETKGLSKDNVQISVAAGDDNTDRKGEIVISYGEMKRTIKVHQYSYAANTIIQFADEKVKAKLVEAFDTNKDGELSIKEARTATTIEGVFGAIKTYTSFDEFRYFTGVTSIPESMFEDWRLTSITLPESITVIGKAAFKNCTVLSSVHSLGAINLSIMPESVFSGCVKLSKIEVPESLITIKDFAFEGCKSLTSIHIPEKVSIIEAGAFYDCELLNNVQIPQNVVRIGAGAFSGCKSLKAVSIPDGVTTLSRGTFNGCESLSEVRLPKYLIEIQSDSYSRYGGMGMCFGGCYSLTHIELPEGLKTIGSYAFDECINLSSVTIPNSVTSIEDGVFYKCSSLTSIELPDGIDNLSACIFKECKKLKNVKIPETISSIGRAAFSGCSSLKDIMIPESVTSIGQYAFCDCCSLKTIVLPESITSIKECTFTRCTDLESIIIPSSVTSIANADYPSSPFVCIGCFEGCISLKTVILPESISTIGNHAFAECKNLAEIVIPQGVTTIKEGTFYNCSSLKSVSLPKNLLTIEGSYYSEGLYPGRHETRGAFEGCSSLISINLPQKMTSIGADAFSECYELITINIPDGIRVIGRATFNKCYKLSAINLPQGIKKIDYEAFQECRSLKTIILPREVEMIGTRAFSGCINLESITSLATTPPSFEQNGNGAQEFASTNGCPIYVPSASLNTYKKSWFGVANRIQAIQE